MRASRKKRLLESSSEHKLGRTSEFRKQSAGQSLQRKPHPVAEPAGPTVPSLDASEDDEFDMFSAGDDDVVAEARRAADAAEAATVAGKVDFGAARRVDELSDAEGYLVARVGALLGEKGRYEVIGELGRGVFSSVFMCIDRLMAPSVGDGSGPGSGSIAPAVPASGAGLSSDTGSSERADAGSNPVDGSSGQ